MAISRSREYAPTGSARDLRQPLWLASALDKIAGGVAHLPNEAAEARPATAPLFIVNPLSGRRMDGLFSTHPATENRIAALVELAQSAGLVAPTREVHGVERGAPRRRGASGRTASARPPCFAATVVGGRGQAPHGA